MAAGVDDEGERASERLLAAMCASEAIELVSNPGLAALAAGLARVLVQHKDGSGRAAVASAWLIGHSEVADLYIDDHELEAYLGKYWDPPAHGLRRTTAARHLELEALLVREPDELAHQLVYSDWLQGQRDPFGELIARRVAAALAPEDPELAASVAAYQADHGEALFGRLAEYLDVVIHPRWRGGFIHAVRVGTAADDPGPYQGAIMLRWLLERPAALLLRELELYPIDHHWARDQHRELLEALFERPRPLVRRLAIVHVGEDDIGRGGDAGRLPDDLGERLPALEQLEVAVRTASARVLDHPRLEILSWAGYIGPELSASLARAKLPRLERLELGSEYVPPGLGPALAKAALPRLRSLRVRADGALLSAIVHAPWREQLEVLELAGGSLDDDDARLLGRLPWPWLRELDVSGNHLEAEGLAALARLGVLVRADRQRRPDFEEELDEDAEDEDEGEDGYYGDIRE